MQTEDPILVVVLMNASDHAFHLVALQGIKQGIIAVEKEFGSGSTQFTKEKTKSPFQNSSSSADNSNVIDKESKNHHSSDLINSSDDSTKCFNPKLAPVATSKEVINLLDSDDDGKFKSSVVNYSDDNEE